MVWRDIYWSLVNLEDNLKEGELKKLEIAKENSIILGCQLAGSDVEHILLLTQSGELKKIVLNLKNNIVSNNIIGLE